MDSGEEVDWIGIAAAVELEEAEAEAAAVEEAAAVAGAVASAPRSTKRKRPHDSDDQQLGCWEGREEHKRYGVIPLSSLYSRSGDNKL